MLVGLSDRCPERLQGRSSVGEGTVFVLSIEDLPHFLRGRELRHVNPELGPSPIILKDLRESCMFFEAALNGRWLSGRLCEVDWRHISMESQTKVARTLVDFQGQRREYTDAVALGNRLLIKSTLPGDCSNTAKCDSAIASLTAEVATVAALLHDAQDTGFFSGGGLCAMSTALSQVPVRLGMAWAYPGCPAFCDGLPVFVIRVLYTGVAGYVRKLSLGQKPPPRRPVGPCKKTTNAG